MKERLIKWFNENKKTIITLLTTLFMAIIGAGCLTSCAGKMSYKDCNGNNCEIEFNIQK